MLGRYTTIFAGTNLGLRNMNDALVEDAGAQGHGNNIGRQAFHHGDLRRALLATAWEVVEERGASMTSLREVARRNGVAASSALHHFGDKMTLLAGVAEEGFRRLANRQIAATVGMTDKKEHLRQYFLIYVQFALNHPAIFKLMHSSLITPHCIYPTLLETSVKTFKMTKEVMQAYLAPVGVSTEIGAEVWGFWSAAHGIALLLINYPPGERPTRVSEEALISNLLDTVLIGIVEKCRLDSIAAD